MATEAKPEAKPDPKPAAPRKPENAPVGARFKTDNLQSSYANFCNANSTKEEVVLNFGLNNSWDRVEPGGGEIDLRHRYGSLK